MPLPLKHRYNFNFDRLIRPPYSEMTAAEAYTDFYGISYMLKGEALADSNLSMTQIALEAVFSSNAYFSDCFRRVMGISPMQFRKTNRNTS